MRLDDWIAGVLVILGYSLGLAFIVLITPPLWAEIHADVQRLDISGLSVWRDQSDFAEKAPRDQAD